MMADRTVLVTGASTGIGEACARELAGRGWRVFAGVRDDDSAKRLTERVPSRLVPVRLDVTDPAHIAAAADLIAREVGETGLDGLVNNAGIVVPGPIEALPIAELRRQMEVNFFGSIAVTQALLPLIRVASGRIVMMSSLNGRVAAPFLGPYAASKFALEAVSDALRGELRRWNIQVAIVEPGSVQTPIWAKSKSTAQRLSDETSDEMRELYGQDIDAMQRAATGLADGAMPVRRVVAAVVHALTARRPKTRYPVGLDAKLAVLLLPRIPDRVCDWIVRRSLGLK
ncbi:MAG TPA: short-chain dehydrogenase/reductase [Planctomycetaceae bacterium]|nr:short-chain dehydrogenase/reductase [Planctomycetaceae bacterium]